MTIFTAAALTAFIAANNCVPPKAADVILGIVIGGEQSRNSLAIHDNTAGVSFTPANEGEAIRLAHALMVHGDDLDLGLGQINTRNLGWLRLTVEMAFDACRNLDAAARVLFVRYNGNPADPLKTAYAQRVMANIRSTPIQQTAALQTTEENSPTASAMEDQPGLVGETLLLGDN